MFCNDKETIEMSLLRGRSYEGVKGLCHPKLFECLQRMKLFLPQNVNLYKKIIKEIFSKNKQNCEAENKYRAPTSHLAGLGESCKSKNIDLQKQNIQEV